MAAHLSIPTVDLHDITDGDPAQRRAAAEALRAGFGEYGLVYVRSHGIDAKLLDAYYDGFLRVTAKPEADKRNLARPAQWYQRGWTPPNNYLAMGRALHAVGATLLRACATALGMGPAAFTAQIEGAPHVTRALRYLPLDAAQAERGILWGEEHTDFNLLTLLPGGRFLDPSGVRCPPPDPGSGLYLRTRGTAEHPEGHMVHGRPPEGCIVAQVGQQLEILTGGTFLATPHVVTAPKTPGYSRLSCAHFVHLHPYRMLFPMEAFRTPETVRAYSPPVLAGTYDLKTLVDIHLAPASALDLLGYRHYDRLTEQRAVHRDA